eukprot:5574698-Prymnesium_polylepis.3
MRAPIVVISATLPLSGTAWPFTVGDQKPRLQRRDHIVGQRSVVIKRHGDIARLVRYDEVAYHRSIRVLDSAREAEDHEQCPLLPC